MARPLIVYPDCLEGKAADVALNKLKETIGDSNRVGLADAEAEETLAGPARL
jgi:hypothetical protein